MSHGQSVLYVCRQYGEADWAIGGDRQSVSHTWLQNYRACPHCWRRWVSLCITSCSTGHVSHFSTYLYDSDCDGSPSNLVNEYSPFITQAVGCGVMYTCQVVWNRHCTLRGTIADHSACEGAQLPVRVMQVCMRLCLGMHARLHLLTSWRFLKSQARSSKSCRSRKRPATPSP